MTKKTNRGKLIQGLTKKYWPYKALFHKKFKKALRDIMRKSPGIYALYDKRKKLYYVGQTQNLFGRIRYHRKDRHSGRWYYLRIFKIRKSKKQYLKDIETIVVNISYPSGNEQEGRIPTNFPKLDKILETELKNMKRDIKKLELMEKREISRELRKKQKEIKRRYLIKKRQLEKKLNPH